LWSECTLLFFFSKKEKKQKKNQLLPGLAGGKLVFFFVAFVGLRHGAGHHWEATPHQPSSK